MFSGLGLYLWMWGIFTAYMFIASLRTTGAVALVFLLLAITFFILGIGNSSLAGTQSVINSTIKLGGWFGDHGARRVVRVVCRGDQLDIRPGRCAGGSAQALTRARKANAKLARSRNTPRQEHDSGAPAATPALWAVSKPMPARRAWARERRRA